MGRRDFYTQKKITLAFGAGTLEWQDLRQGRWRGRKRLRPHGFCRDFAGGERELPNTLDNATRRDAIESRTASPASGPCASATAAAYPTLMPSAGDIWISCR